MKRIVANFGTTCPGFYLPLREQKAGMMSVTNALLHRGLSKAKREKLEQLALLERQKKTPEIKKEIEQLKATVAAGDKSKRIESEVVESLMAKMIEKGYTQREKKGLLTKEEEAERDLKSYTISKKIVDKKNANAPHILSHSTPIDHLSLQEIYEYSYAALKGGEIEKAARRRIPISMRMAVGERSTEVPPPSFIYILLQNDPSLLQESYHPRIAYAIEQWVKLNDRQRQYFVDHPLKGISE